MSERSGGLARRLGTFDATLIVTGGIIGSGIFMTPAVVAQAARTAPLIIAAWCIGGLIALAGGFIFAELAWRHTGVQGMYGYLRDAFHPMLAFMSGWTGLLVTQTGGMAAAAVTFATYFAPLTGWNIPPVYVGLGALLVLNAINLLGVREGGTTQNILMICKTGAILAIVAAGFFGPHTPAHAMQALPHLSGGIVLTMFFAALIPVLFSYDGWQTAAFLDAEMKDPRKSLPRALVWGVLGVVALYLLVTLAGLHMLGPRGLAASSAPASDMMRLWVGPVGARIVAAGIAISTLGYLSNQVLCSPRLFFAMAQDGLFFKQFAWLHPRTRVPVYSILAQCIIAALITLSGKYDQILSYVVSMDFFFLGVAAIALLIFVSRARSQTASGVTVPGGRWTTAIFIAICAAIVAESFVTAPRETSIGFALLLSGAPVYVLWARGASGRRVATEP